MDGYDGKHVTPLLTSLNNHEYITTQLLFMLW